MSLGELLQRYWQQVQDAWLTLVFAIAVAALMSVPWTRRQLSRVGMRGRWVVLGFVIVAALYWASKLAWMADDAYISFRYARNLIQGHGLVYNPGERVEGYTNFLWTVLVALFMWPGLHAEHVSVFLNALTFIFLILTERRLAGHMVGHAVRGNGASGMAVLLTAASYGLVSFITGGLETLFALTLVLASAERAVHGRFLTAGVLGVAATMARPDHGLFAVFLGIALIWHRTPWRGLLRFGVPFVCLYLPYFALRYLYYGALLPNTFYAKSGGGAYYEQGLTYLLMTFVGAGLFGLMPLVLFGAVSHRRHLFVRFAVMAVPGFAFYLARVGGDFMYLRMALVLFPPFFVLADAGHRSLLAAGRWCAALGLAVLAVTAALPVRLIRGTEVFHHVADERAHYPLGGWAPPEVAAGHVEVGKALADAFPDGKGHPKIAIGNIGIIGYISRLDVFDTMGLTSREVAQTEIKTRGRPGHERGASPTQVLSSGTVLSGFPVYPHPFSEIGHATAGPWNFHLTRYDRGVVQALRGSTRTSITDDYEDRLTELYRSTESMPEHMLACERWHQTMFYFQHNPASRLWDKAKDWVRQTSPDLTGMEAVAFGHVSPSRLGFTPVWTAHFDDRRGWTPEGRAFSRWPARGKQGDQMDVIGNEGRFINTYTARAGDAVTGSLTSAPFIIDGDVITLAVGGGQDPERLRVELVVEGAVVHAATGCNIEVLGRRIWNVVPHRGKEARIRIIDRHQGGFGHLLVDSVVEWKRGA